MDEENSSLDAKEVLRANLCKYTRQAFHLLPELNKPRILDIGCGAGVPTMELAGLSSGQITGVDVNQSLLDRLERRIKETGLSDRVKTVNCSMLDMSFPDESFDLLNELEDDERELALFRMDPARFRSVFYVIKKLSAKSKGTLL